MFMQAGFAFLEIGFSRGKNAGTVVAKILTNFSIAARRLVGCRIRVRVRRRQQVHRARRRVLLHRPRTVVGDGRRVTTFRPDFPVMSLSDATIESKFFFQFVFCAVSLAIVWGTTLERIKFGVYVDLRDRLQRRSSTRSAPTGCSAAASCRPVTGSAPASSAMQDFAGSTAVHLIGATGALAALLLLGPRKGKYGADGKPRAIPGHNMPLFGLGVLILWLGWFGFNPGSTLDALDGRFAEILLITNLAAAAGVLAAVITATAEDRRRSTSAWPATARSRVWSRSPLRRATSSSGRRRSSARSPA